MYNTDYPVHLSYIPFYHFTHLLNVNIVKKLASFGNLNVRQLLSTFTLTTGIFEKSECENHHRQGTGSTRDHTRAPTDTGGYQANHKCGIEAHQGLDAGDEGGDEVLAAGAVVVRDGERRGDGLARAAIGDGERGLEHTLLEKGRRPVERSRAVTVVGETGLVAVELGILTIKGFTEFRTGDFLAVVVIAGGLARIWHRVGSGKGVGSGQDAERAGGAGLFEGCHGFVFRSGGDFPVGDA